MKFVGPLTSGIAGRNCTYQRKKPITSNDYYFRGPHCQSKKRRMFQPQHYVPTMIKGKIRRSEPGICIWPNILFCWYWCLFSPSPNSLPEGWRLFFCFFFFCLAAWWLKQCQLRKSISITPNDQNSFDIWPPYMIFLKIIGLLKLIFCQDLKIMNHEFLSES